jgi:hypothetical protein
MYAASLYTIWNIVDMYIQMCSWIPVNESLSSVMFDWLEIVQ